MYNKIKNPLTNRFVNVESSLGKQIINNYIKVLYGGSNSDSEMDVDFEQQAELDHIDSDSEMDVDFEQQAELDHISNEQLRVFIVLNKYRDSEEQALEELKADELIHTFMNMPITKIENQGLAEIYNKVRKLHFENVRKLAFQQTKKNREGAKNSKKLSRAEMRRLNRNARLGIRGRKY